MKSIYNALILLLCMCATAISNAQLITPEVSGPSPVYENTTHTYIYNSSIPYALYQWTITGGTEISRGYDGFEYHVVIQWNSPGLGRVKFMAKGGPSSEKSVTVLAASTPPAVPDMPAITMNYLSTRLTRGTPPAGIVWYWQDDDEGMSQLNDVLYVDRLSGDEYYLRAYNPATSLWSDMLTINYYIDTAHAASLSDENYIYTMSPQIPTTDVETLPNDKKIETVTYYDGLGRPMQSIGIRNGGLQEDIVTPFVYDAYGRQTKEYLPYPNQSHGVFTSTTLAISELETYYVNNFSEDVDVLNPNPYSERLLENSPLNRVLEQAAPGEDWLLNEASDTDHTIKFDLGFNTANEVRYFTVNHPNGDTEQTELIYDVNNGYYAANELYKTVTKDENWQPGQQYANDHTVVEFKNVRGQVILKRAYNNNQAHDTQYVYDAFGNLTYVLSPEGSENILDGSNNVQQAVLDNLCYQYRYDYRNRLVEKRMPGKQGWEYIIYDTLDRPILTQDAVQRDTNQWLYIKYDAYGRVIFTGTLASAWATRTAFQSFINTNIDNEVFDLYETRTTTPTVISHDPTATSLYYTNNAFPNGGAQKVLTINYYDDYTNLGLTTEFDVENPFNQTLSTNHKNLTTVMMVKVLTTPYKWITTVNYYDDKARAIYAYSKNEYLNTTDAVATELDFTGKVIQSKATHTKTGQTTIVVDDTFTYDHMGRLLTQSQSVNGATVELIVNNHYDDLGQLEQKNVGGTVAAIPEQSTGLQTVDYDYNIRGWLTQINDPTNLGSDLFGFKINYNNLELGDDNIALFSGSISETIWKTKNDVTTTTIRGYSYKYDALNRLLYADGAKSTNNGLSYTFFAGYDEEILGYDLNGNINRIKRYQTAGALMDNIEYTYAANSNQLLKTEEDSTDAIKDQGFFDGNTLGNDYDYDDNGNMIKDLNKGITNITYNYFDLPTQVTIDNGTIIGTITYIYDATGVKLAKVVSEGSSLTTTRYAGNYIYKETALGENLEFFNHPEGYIKPNTSGGFDYIYQYKDHLGNIRLAYKDNNGSLEIQEENNYYPFGLKHKGYNNVINGTDYPYGYNAKEEQNDLNLGWINLGARMLDPSIGRFVTIDPMADFVNYQSPYVLSDNNPVGYIDIYGLGRGKTPWWLRWLIGGRKDDCDCTKQEGVIGFIARQVGKIGKPKAKKNNGKGKKGKGKKSKNKKKKSKSKRSKPSSSTKSSPRDILSPIEIEREDVVPFSPDFGMPEISVPMAPELPKHEGIDIVDPIGFDKKVNYKGNSDKFVDEELTEKILNDLVKTLKEYPQLQVLILSSTSADPDAERDSTLSSPGTLNGNPSTVGEIQLARARAVEAFLISKGINWRRINIGYGEIKYEGEKGRTTRFILIPPKE